MTMPAILGRTGPRHARALGALSLLAVMAVACGGGGGDRNVTPDDVDQSSEPYVTDRERATFTPPADGVLVADQVDRYLRTTLLQFDLIRKESEGMREQVQRIEQRGERPGVLGGLRNLGDLGRLAGSVDVIAGGYVRAARSLGYNPAEMEWVGERMAEAAGYLAMEQMMLLGRGAAEQLRAQARELEQANLPPEAIQEMLSHADEVERDLAGDVDQTARRNADVLRRAKPAVTEPMWLALGWHGGYAFMWAGLADPDDADAQRQIEEYRRIFEDALENRATPGMERE
jgi:hypothetical protein